jgi:predicted enzyme related to lactoylglutathione lyase
MVPKFRWINLRTRDVEAARTFYSALFGWQTRPVDSGGAFKHLFESDGNEIAGLAEITQWEASTPPHWLAFVDVDDLDARVGEAQELGGKILWGPQHVESRGRFVVLQDPTGAVFGLWEIATD